jgi:2-O-methyltransferase
MKEVRTAPLDVDLDDCRRPIPKCKIYAFEPDPRAISKFKSRITDPRVHLTETAIGSSDGTASFNVSSGLPPDMPSDMAAQFQNGWDLSGSLRTRKTHKSIYPWIKFESRITVPVKRLDSWAREHGIEHIDFIWADVQGAESDLIEGGKNTLAKTRYFYTEYSNHEQYEGQVNLQQLSNMLEGFIIVRRFILDILSKNLALDRKSRKNANTYCPAASV